MKDGPIYKKPLGPQPVGRLASACVQSIGLEVISQGESVMGIREVWRRIQHPINGRAKRIHHLTFDISVALPEPLATQIRPALHAIALRLLVCDIAFKAEFIIMLPSMNGEDYGGFGCRIKESTPSSSCCAYPYFP
jgi:hypothetical protein